MTQPIQEPSVQRQLRTQRYGIDQLFRRPCRSCGGNLPYADMYWFFPGGTAVSNATYTPLTDLGDATAAFSTDTAVFDASNLASGSITWDDDLQHGAPALAKAQLVWTATTTWGPRQVSLHASSAYSLDFEAYNSNELTLSNPGASIGQYQETQMFFFLGRSSESTEGAVSMSIYHEMGGDEDVVWAALSIIRLNPASDFTAYPGDTYFP